MLRKVFGQTYTHGPNDMPDGIHIVIARDSNKNFCRTDFLKSCFRLGSEWGETGAHDGMAAGSDVGSQT